jgi:hypothetical protein
MTTLSLLFPLLLAASAVPSAPDWVLQDSSYQTFLTRLQDAVRSDDRKAVIELIDFPLRVNSESGTRLYPDAQAVARDYDRIFTPEVRRAVLDQRFDRLFGRDQGVMIGDGEIWFDHSCTNAECSPPGPVRITAVNR